MGGENCAISQVFKFEGVAAFPDGPISIPSKSSAITGGKGQKEEKTLPRTKCPREDR